LSNLFSSPAEAIDLLLAGKPLLDVRAPVEFERGHIPGTINLPLINSEEREVIGRTYKESGQAAAVTLGHQMVSGELKSGRVSAWKEAITKNNIPAIFCARGGMRSEISQSWLKAVGVEIPRVKGGYKFLRAELLKILNAQIERSEFLLVDGRTGVGKTTFLHELSSTHGVIDLEQAANHRGSAFGWKSSGQQPAQATFENDLALQLERAKNKGPILIEAESAWIGGCSLPRKLYQKMTESKFIVLESTENERVERILSEYVAIPLSQVGAETLQTSILRSLSGIQRRLGGDRTKVCRQLVDEAFLQVGNLELHKEWIRYLLRNYYDPLYDKLMERRAPNRVSSGDAQHLRCYL